MFIQLNHKSLKIYEATRELAKEIYVVSMKLPVEEKFNMIQQMRRAALSVKLNLAEGATRKSPNERRRFYEVARGCVIEIDSALDISVDLNYLSKEKLAELGQLLVRTFQMISKMIS